jgi:hypothetical protein
MKNLLSYTNKPKIDKNTVPSAIQTYIDIELCYNLHRNHESELLNLSINKAHRN